MNTKSIANTDKTPVSHTDAELGFIKEKESLVLEDSSRMLKDACVWKVRRWCLDGQPTQVFSSQIDVEFCLDTFKSNFGDELVSIPEYVSRWELVVETRGIWLFFEVLSGEEVSGIFGFYLSFMAEKNHLSICLTNYIALGQVDATYYHRITERLMHALGIADLDKSVSLFEIKVEISELISSSFSRHNEKYRTLAKRIAPKHFFRVQLNQRASWSLVLSSPGMSEVFLLPPPIEVLESNQLAGKLKKAEELASIGQFAEAKRSLYESVETDIGSLYITRREALINLMSGDDYSLEQIEKLLRQDRHSLLFFSLLYRTAKKSEDTILQLKALSQIGLILSERIEYFEQLSVFDLVFAELLGDAWLGEDPEKAFECYKRILLRRTPTKRILEKFLPLARSLGRHEELLEYSKRLLAITSEKSIKSRLLLELAELVEPSEAKHAAGYATKAWQLNPTNYSLASYVVDLWIKAECAENAVSVLDQYLANNLTRISKEDQLAIELKITRIWAYQLNRQDLAIDRLKRASMIPIIQLDSLTEILGLAKDLSEKIIEVRSYERIFAVSAKQKNIDLLISSLNFLLAHYRSQEELVNIKKLHISLVEDYIEDVQDIDDLMRSHDIEIDWRLIFQHLEVKISKKPTEQLKSLYLGMGKVAQSNLFDRELAANLYEKALEHGCLESSLFSYLDDYYSRKHDLANRTRILKIQLAQAGPSESSEILKQLFYTSESNDSATADEYALELHRSNQEQEPLKRRLMYYQTNGNLEGFTKLLSQILDRVADSENKIYWLDLALEILSEFDSEDRFEPIQKYLRMLEVLHEDTSYVRELGVKYHQNNPDPKSLSYYLDKLIASGITPKLDPALVLRSLSDQKASKGYFLLHLAKTEDNEDARFQLFQRSLAILKNFGEAKKAIVETYQDLADSYTLNIQDLSDFLKACVDMDTLSIFTRSLLSQIQKMPQASFDLDLFNFVLDFLKTHSIESELIVPVVIKRIQQLKSTLRDRLMFELFQSIENKEEYFPDTYAYEYLSEAEHWDFSPGFKKLFEWVYEKDKASKDLERIAQSLIDFFVNKNDDKRVARLVDFLSQKNITTMQGCWLAFRHFLSQGSIQKSQQQWFKALGFSKTSSDYRKFYDHSMRVFESSEVSAGVEDFVAFVVEERLDQKLPADVRYELRLDYALKLFSSDRHQDLIYEILKQQFNQNKDDERVWIPLFFLSGNLKHFYDMYDLLKFIIPRIASKPDILNTYPLTLESLEKEYVKVARNLNLPDTIATYVSSISVNSPKISVAERNLMAESNVVNNTSDLTDFRLGAADSSVASVPKKAPSKSSSTQSLEKTNKLPPVPDQTTGSNVSWKSIAASLVARKGDAQKIFEQDFQNKEEKHLALQFASLIEGRLDILDFWDSRVWRDVNHYFYDPSRRTPNELMLTSIRQPMQQVVLNMKSVFDALYHSHFTLRGLSERLNIKIDEFIRMRSQIILDEIPWKVSAFRFYRPVFDARNYRFFDFSGLGAMIHFEFQQKVFYIDTKFYKTIPAHILFHRLLQVSKLIERNYLKLLNLSLRGEIAPVIEELLAYFKVNRSLNRFQIRRDDRSFTLEKLTSDELKSLEESLANIDTVDLQSLKSVLDDLQAQAILDCLYETLDLVGLLETHCGRDVVEDDHLRQRAMKARYWRGIFAHASKFRF